jgi:catechol 2,3-dioxygenase-like lactoylglutathione lyase family enzyme
MIVTGIDHVVLRVTNMDRAIAFYADVLGCRVEHRQDALGLVHLRAGTSLIDLVDVAGKLGRMGGGAAGATGRNMDHICLRIAAFDVDKITRELAAHGIVIGETAQRFGSTGEATSIYLTDPEGNGLELRA